MGEQKVDLDKGMTVIPEEITIKTEPGLIEIRNESPHLLEENFEDTYTKLIYDNNTSPQRSEFGSVVHTDYINEIKREVLSECEAASVIKDAVHVSGTASDDLMHTIEQNFEEIDEIICGTLDARNGLNVETGKKRSIEMVEVDQNSSSNKDPHELDLSDVLSAVDHFESSFVSDVKSENIDAQEDVLFEDYTSGSETEPFCDSSGAESVLLDPESDDGDQDLDEIVDSDQALLDNMDMSDCCIHLKDICKTKSFISSNEPELEKSCEIKDDRTRIIKGKSKKELSLQCKVCNHSLKNLKSLLVHSRIHRKFNYMCCICGPLYRYSTLRGFDKHMASHGKASFECKICGRIFKHEKKLKFHGVRHGIKPFQCDQCSKAYYSQTELAVHKRTHTNERPFKCNVCESAFTSYGYLKNHEQCHADRIYPCKICSKKFKRKEHMVAHLRVHSDERCYKCPLCDKTYKNKASISLHKRSHTGERVTCEICQSSFRDPGDLKRHYRLHTDEKNYKCDTCGMTFKTLRYLQSHVKIKHLTSLLDKEKNKCHICGKCFRFNCALQQHIKFHTAKKAFHCTQCEKSFKFREWLEKHVNLVHNRTGEKIKCTECDKTFTSKGGLLKHMKYHKLGRRFSCKYCGQTYLYSNHLKRHIDYSHLNVQHKRYKCEVCGKEVANLKTHMQTHDDAKPYPCEKCGRCFQTEKKLNLHKRVHWKNKPYTCKYCDTGFTQKGNWELHLKRAHNKLREDTDKSETD